MSKQLNVVDKNTLNSYIASMDKNVIKIGETGMYVDAKLALYGIAETMMSKFDMPFLGLDETFQHGDGRYYYGIDLDNRKIVLYTNLTDDNNVVREWCDGDSVDVFLSLYKLYTILQ